MRWVGATGEERGGRKRYLTIDGYAREGGERAPSDEAVAMPKTRRTTLTHSHTHAQSKHGGVLVEIRRSRSVRMMLRRVTTAY